MRPASPRSVFVVTLIAVALLAVPAGAENRGLADAAPDATPETDWMERLEAVRREALEALRALRSETEQLIDELPRYKMPYVDEDGNIIIERDHGDGAPNARPDPDPNRDDEAAPAEDVITL